MGAWEFNNPEVLKATAGPDDQYLKVSGPFDPAGLNPIRGDVIVRYELIQELSGQPKAIIDGYGKWDGPGTVTWTDILT